jgi:hypothetical protein
MAVEKVVIVKVDTTQAVQSFDQLTETIQEQKDILIEFQQELKLLETQLIETGKAAFNPRGDAIKKQIENLKDAIKDQRLSLKDLNNERSKARESSDDYADGLTRNTGLVGVLNKFTGGLAGKFVDVAKAATKSGKAMKAALISTGIGLLVVAVGLLVEHWEDIVGFMTGANDRLEKQISLTKELAGENDARLALLESERKEAELLGESLEKNTADQRLRREEIRRLAVQDVEDKTTAFELARTRSRGGNAEDREAFRAASLARINAENNLVKVRIANQKFEDDLLKKKKVDPADPEFVGPGSGDVLNAELEAQELVRIEEWKNKEFERLLMEAEEDEMEAEDLRLENLEKTQLAASAIRKKEDKQVEDAFNRFREIKELEKDFALNAAADMFFGLSQLAKEGSKEQEAFAIASILVSAAVASIGIWEGYSPTLPWGLAGLIATQVAVAAATIGAIKQVKSSGAGGGPSTRGGNGAPGGSALGSAPATANGQQTLTDATNQRNLAPVRSYVLASDVATQLALERQISNNSSLGT